MKFLFLIFFILMSLPGLCQEDFEVIESRENSTSSPTPLVIPEIDSAIELKKLGYESINARALTDKRVILLIKRILEESQLSEVPPDVVKGLILDKLKGSLLGDFLKAAPRLLDLLVDIMRDKKALSGLIDIALRREDLKSYIHFWIAFLIAAWLLKKATFKKEWGRLKTIGLGLCVSFIITGVSVTIFYNTFEKELGPTIKILSRHWNQA